MADWSQLPREILQLIGNHLDICFDNAHFRSVCSSWRSSIPPSSRKTTFSLTLKKDKDDEDEILKKNSIFLLRLPQSPNQASLSPCWLVKIREIGDGQSLPKDPFHSAQGSFVVRIRQPSCFSSAPSREPKISSLDTLNCRVIPLGIEYLFCSRYWHEARPYLMESSRKVAFMQLSNDHSDFAMLKILSSGKVKMFKSVDKEWRVIEEISMKCQDSISFKGKFYVVGQSDKTFIVKASSEVSFFQQGKARNGKKRLVQAGGDLLLVDICTQINDAGSGDLGQRRRNCEVFKLDEEEQKWDPVHDLGDLVLFLANDCAFACSADEIAGLKGNSIFFQDNKRGSPEVESYFLSLDDVLVFSLTDESVKPMKDCPSYVGLIRPPPQRAVSMDPFVPAIGAIWSDSERFGN